MTYQNGEKKYEVLIDEEDRDFIQTIMQLSQEKKILLKGLLTGLELQTEPLQLQKKGGI